MKKEHFFDKYINLEKLEKAMNELNASKEQKKRLLEVARKTVYLELTHLVLDNFKGKDKYQVLVQMEYFPDERATRVLVENSMHDFKKRARGIVMNVEREFISLINDHVFGI